MKIGVPKEIKPQEHRIGLTPDSVKTLISEGHEVLVENNGGFEAGFENEQYTSIGAKIIDKTEDILLHYMHKLHNVRYISTSPIQGFGVAVRHGLQDCNGKAVIIVMADGQVIETGTHEALLARGGAYTDLYNLQLNKAESA